MKNLAASCPMTLKQIVNEYFAESRNQLLELAAFFDRLDRARDGADPENDFRVAAMKRAAAVLLQPGPQRVKRMLLLLSDPTEEPRGHLDRKGALGAYSPMEEAV